MPACDVNLMAMSKPILTEPVRFYYQGAVRELRGVAPTRTVLQHLREDLHCTGTKEGCAEGDCGACTVVVGELVDGKVTLKSVNACIQLLPTLDGKALFSVEDVALPSGDLHPVQQAMVECHGSQCGFCTPGFVMSLWGMYVNGDGRQPQRCEIDAALSGNLCRCTGYKPIIDAARRMNELPAVTFDRAALADALTPLQRTTQFNYEAGGQQFFAPRTLAELVAIRAAKPDALIVAGSTDVGLWITKQLRTLGDIIYISQVDALARCNVVDGGVLEIGAAVTLEQAYGAIAGHYPQLQQMWQRFASLPVRNAGTLGGNVANGSPIGDSMPWMIAVGAQVVINGANGQRVLALEDLYLGYQKKDLHPGEFIEAVRIPLPRAGRQFRTYKLAKRFDQDISAVCAAFAFDLDGDTITGARIAFGGMAATPKRATNAEALLQGRAWTEATRVDAMAALAMDFAPLSDMRASNEYRLQTAQNLLRRYWYETRPNGALPEAHVNVFAGSAA